MGVTLQQHTLKPAQFAWSMARAIADDLFAEDRGSLGGAFYALTKFMLGQASKTVLPGKLGLSRLKPCPQTLVQLCQGTEIHAVNHAEHALHYGIGKDYRRKSRSFDVLMLGTYVGDILSLQEWL